MKATLRSTPAVVIGTNSGARCPCRQHAAPRCAAHGSENSSAAQSIPQRAAAAATACLLAATLVATPSPALAEGPVEPVYFGNGCFWGRQYDFVNAEKSLGRKPEDLSAVVGYAGGRLQSPSGKVCYYYAGTVDKGSVYEGLGHAEVVQVELRGQEFAEKEQEYRKFADTFFSQFRRLPGGKNLRQDPQDAGPGYRNVVGLPGGVRSPLFKILQEANVNGMELREGSGNEWKDGKPTEDDLLNVVWVVDSAQLPFYRAEVYHQFHNGLGKAFPREYTKDLKEVAMEKGKVAETGCPEFFFMGS